MTGLPARTTRPARRPPGAWTLEIGDGPVVAAAIHAGSDLRPGVAREIALDSATRRREEDGWTDLWTEAGDVRIIVHRSRFEVDMNRTREGCVYQGPEDAWGLEVWRRPPSEILVARSRALHDAFRAEVGAVLDRQVERFGRFVLLDLHSYNHRRRGPDHPDPPASAPDVNLGTGTLDRRTWAPVVDAFLAALEGRSIGGRRLVVGENVRFRGGDFPRWVNATWPGRGCALAVEVKKFYVDEWTGEPDPEVIRAIGRLLAGTAPRLVRALRSVPEILAG